MNTHISNEPLTSGGGQFKPTATQEVVNGHFLDRHGIILESKGTLGLILKGSSQIISLSLCTNHTENDVHTPTS